ncbi:MAG TPA: YdaS family helix-turn-helix protein, partial [Anaerolineae bacterium]|nr:YdaS family helix-turn-helix protein [Anaerolineae bacterium]
MNLTTAIQRAQGQAKLARACGVTYQAVQRWLRTGVPPERCAAVEAATGVRCEDLCPGVTWLRDSAGRVTGYTV